MIKRRMKYQYLVLFAFLIIVLPVFTISTIVSSSLKEEETEDSPEVFTEEIVEESKPVLNETTKVLLPYTDQSVKVGKKYYEYQASAEDQVDSIIKHDNTYIQNSGIDYVADKEFDVVAILNGTVTSVKEDKELGSSIEIKHDNEYISVYQSLSKVNVKKGDIVNQGQVIGTSGTNELDKELGNHLHFEVYYNGGVINPENYLNKEIPLKKEN